MKRPAPLSLAAAALFLSGVILYDVAGSAHAGDITKETCDMDYQTLLSDIARNRDQSIQDIQSELDATQNPTTRVHLAYEQERVWDDEETQRNQASVLYRDCLRAADMKS